MLETKRSKVIVFGLIIFVVVFGYMMMLSSTPSPDTPIDQIYIQHGTAPGDIYAGDDPSFIFIGIFAIIGIVMVAGVVLYMIMD